MRLVDMFFKFIIAWSCVFIFIQCSQPQKRSFEKINIQPDSILTDSSGDTSNLRLKADLLYGNDQFLDALELYDKLIEADSTVGKFFFRKAYCLVRMYRHIESVSYYLKSAELNYEVYDSYYSIALTYIIVDKNEVLATKYLNKCLEIKPEAEDVKKMLSELKKNNINL